MFNYAASTDAEVTSAQPKAPFIVSTAQIKGFEDIWAEMGTKRTARICHTTLIPKPGCHSGSTRRSPQAPGFANADGGGEHQAHHGDHDASLGARSNETSGRAILARKEGKPERDLDLMPTIWSKAITHTGCILVDMIPRIYETRSGSSAFLARTARRKWRRSTSW